MNIKILIVLFFSASFSLSGQIFYVNGNLSKSKEKVFFNFCEGLLRKNNKLFFYLNGYEKRNRIKLTKISDFNSLIDKISLNNESNLNEYLSNSNLNKKIRQFKIINQFPNTSELNINNSIYYKLDEINKLNFSKKDVIILNLNKNKITLENSTLKNNITVSIPNFEFKGFVNSQVDISKVQYKLNNEVWKEIDIDKNISNENLYDFIEKITFAKIGQNSIVVRIFDLDNNVQQYQFDRIIFNQILLNENNCRFVHPNKFGNNVLKRFFQKRSEIVFWFKIETTANLDGLSLIRCDRNKNILVQVPLYDKYVISGENYYCFGLTYDELQLGPDPCHTELTGLQSLNWIYLFDASNKSRGEMISVVFSTITPDEDKKQKTPLAECGL